MYTALFLFSSVLSVYSEAKFDAIEDIVYVKNAVDKPLQSLDIYSPKGGDNLPVVIFIHGGAWSQGDKAYPSHHAKRDFFVQNGMVFVSVNYRLAPQYSFPDYPKDVAAAFSFVKDNIAQYRGNPNNIFLMGHSAGGHLAALISTDHSYLHAHQKELGNIRGAILLDGAAYDIISTLSKHPLNLGRKGMFSQAFGSDKAVLRRASVISHVAPGKDIPPFLNLYVKTRIFSLEQSTLLQAALESADIPVTAMSYDDTNHGLINSTFGEQMGGREKAVLEFIQENAI